MQIIANLLASSTWCGKMYKEALLSWEKSCSYLYTVDICPGRFVYKAFRNKHNFMWIYMKLWE